MSAQQIVDVFGSPLGKYPEERDFIICGEIEAPPSALSVSWILGIR
jgi:hypothetical protein